MKLKIFLMIVICTYTVLWSVATAENQSDDRSSVHSNIRHRLTKVSENPSNGRTRNRPNLWKASTENLAENHSSNESTVEQNKSYNTTSAAENQSESNSSVHLNKPTASVEDQSESTVTSAVENQSRHNSNLPTETIQNQSDGELTVHPNIPRNPTSSTGNPPDQSTLQLNTTAVLVTTTTHVPITAPVTTSPSDATSPPVTTAALIETTTPITNASNESDDSHESNESNASTENQSHDNSSHEPTEAVDEENIPPRKEYVSFQIFAKIDNKLARLVKQIEKIIKKDLKTFVPFQSTSYHMVIYSIYNMDRCDQYIPPIERWYNATGETIPNLCSKIPSEALEEQNNEAICYLKRNLNEPLKIKYASLNIGRSMISLTLEVDAESLERIQNARKKMAEIYEHPDLPMEPINEKLYMQLAYGRRSKVSFNDLNRLNLLIRPFIGAKLTLPSIYIDDSRRFIEFQGNTDCSS